MTYEKIEVFIKGGSQAERAEVARYLKDGIEADKNITSGTHVVYSVKHTQLEEEVRSIQKMAEDVVALVKAGQFEFRVSMAEHRRLSLMEDGEWDALLVHSLPANLHGTAVRVVVEEV